MCGVSVRMMSVSVRSRRVRANRRPTIGMSLMPGRPSITVRSSSRIKPPRMLVSPSLSRISVATERLPNVGRLLYPVPEMLLTSTFSTSDTSSL